MKKKDYKKIRRYLILVGNFIISALLLLNIKEVKTTNDYRLNILYILIAILLILLNIFILNLKNKRKDLKK